MTETATYHELAPQWDHFQQAGHSLAAVLIGVLGGLLARRFYNTQESVGCEPHDMNRRR